MLDGRHYQTAYVTRDIAKAAAAFNELYGLELAPFEVTYEADKPTGRQTMTVKLALGWHSGEQIELIEPISGDIGLYADGLPAGDAPRFHHVAIRVADWDALKADIAAKGWPIAMEGGGELLRFLYVDARDTLGHYLEFTWMVEERWLGMGGTA